MAAAAVATPVGLALPEEHSECSAWPVGLEKVVHLGVRGQQVEVKRVWREALMEVMVHQALVLALMRVARSALWAQWEPQVAPAVARCSLSEAVVAAQCTPADCSGRRVLLR